MRLYVTVNGNPAIIVGYAPDKSGPMAIVIGLSDSPQAVRLAECILPKLPKCLDKKIKAWVKAETKSVREALGSPTELQH